MGLSQAALADRLRIRTNTVARMERSEQAITPSMELLLYFVAREAGIEVAHGPRSRGAVGHKSAHGANARTSVRKGRQGEGS
jgi:transcriptional regulator with XRE-family HTH domain